MTRASAGSHHVALSRFKSAHAGSARVPGADEDVCLSVRQILRQTLELPERPRPCVLIRSGGSLAMHSAWLEVGEPK